MCALKLENIQLYHWKQGVIIDEPLKETIISGSQFKIIIHSEKIQEKYI